MARRLEACKEAIALLVVLDSGGPLWQPRRLADGTPFDEVMNSALRRADEDVDCFSTANTARLLSWLSETVMVGVDGTPINRYLDEVYRLRSDVRDIYPDLEGEDATWFVGWAWTQGRAQMGLAEQLLPQPANQSWREPIDHRSLRDRIADLTRKVSWRVAEASDLLTRERRTEAAIRRAKRVREAGLRAWYDYRAGPYGGVVTLIRSEDQAMRPLLARWLALETDGVAERHVRGTHRSMMREPDVESLTNCIAELVERSSGLSPRSSAD
jgi:hypothetical protein